MPIKQVTCDVCNKLVNKAQTLSIGGDKRACRTHPEVDDKAKSAQEHIKQESAKRDEAAEAKRRSWRASPEKLMDLRPKCFGCRNPGNSQQEFFLKMLECNEAYRLAHGRSLNPFDSDAVLAAYEPMKGMLCLWTLPYQEGMRLPYASREVGKMMGVVMLCKPCCDERGIDPHAHLKGLSPSDLRGISAAYETIIQPAIQESVKQKLESEGVVVDKEDKSMVP